MDDMVKTILDQGDGWKITEDRISRIGHRVVRAVRYGDDGIARCIAELKERNGVWDSPALQPCFAPGVIL